MACPATWPGGRKGDFRRCAWAAPEAPRGVVHHRGGGLRGQMQRCSEGLGGPLVSQPDARRAGAWLWRALDLDAQNHKGVSAPAF